MGQTKEGSIKALVTIRERYGEDHYKRIGTLGGSVSCKKGFSVRRDLASASGMIGGLSGRKSKRSKQFKAKLDRAYVHLMEVQEKARRERYVTNKGEQA